eukprot:10587387-Alexandrium_andersonii.AAC.1
MPDMIPRHNCKDGRMAHMLRVLFMPTSLASFTKKLRRATGCSRPHREGSAPPNPATGASG